MLTTDIESFQAGLQELKGLLGAHYSELAMDQEKVPLSPRFKDYFILEQAGELLYVTLRDEGKLVGYFIGFIRPGLHYSTCLQCTLDIFWTRPEYRTGRSGITLFKAVEKELRRRGVQRWVVSSKVHAPADALFKRLKFKPIETAYSKWIGD